jgi:hypothetical protein
VIVAVAPVGVSVGVSVPVGVAVSVGVAVAGTGVGLGSVAMGDGLGRLTVGNCGTENGNAPHGLKGKLHPLLNCVGLLVGVGVAVGSSARLISVGAPIKSIVHKTAKPQRIIVPFFYLSFCTRETSFLRQITYS